MQPRSAKQFGEELADLGSPIGAFVRERCVIVSLPLRGVREAVYSMDAMVQGAAPRPSWHDPNLWPRPTRRGAGPCYHLASGSRTGERLRYYQGIGYTAMTFGSRWHAIHSIVLPNVTHVSYACNGQTRVPSRARAEAGPWCPRHGHGARSIRAPLRETSTKSLRALHANTGSAGSMRSKLNETNRH